MTERRVELGFEGGAMLRLTVDESRVQEVVATLTGGGDGWRTVEADEGTFWIDPDDLHYVRLVPGDPQRIGFGGS